jgi:putative ABC transport system permease protein
VAELAIAWRLARRELRGGLAGFRVFLACLTLGVAAIAGVGSVSSTVATGLSRDGQRLLGGDVELRLSHREAEPTQRAWLAARATVSHVADLKAMARTGDGASAMIELKAVDGAYPLYGTLKLDPPMTLAEALAPDADGRGGAVAEANLLDRLGLGIGQRLGVGDAEFVLRATVTHEPDRATGLFSFGPRLMVGLDQLAATGLVRPGSLVSHHYRLRLAPATDMAAWIARLEDTFPDAGWRLRSRANAAPGLAHFIERLSLFLTLVGLTALLVGGVGIGNSVKGYLDGKTATIATLKCLGAPGRLVFQVYLLQVLAIALVGIAMGLVLGALAPIAAASTVEALLPVSAPLGLYPGPLLLAAGFGLLASLAFVLWPLARAREVPGASLFRDEVAPARRWPRAAYVLATVAAALALAGLAIASAEETRFAVWFVLGAAATLLAFRLAAAAVMAIARASPRPRDPRLRLAIANLHRPGAPTAAVVLSLGIGLTVLVTVALIEDNLARQIEERLPKVAPSHFFIDIQPDQISQFEALVRAQPGASDLRHVPIIRGRIMRLAGRPVSEVAIAPGVAWVTRGDRALTYAAAPPARTRIVAGDWWPDDYAGPPLVSLDAEAAAGMGLAVGDHITFNVLGREIRARIANLRHIEWRSLGMNFVVIFAPGTLERAPYSHIASVRAGPGAEAALERAVTERFANVATIRVKDALEAVNRMLVNIAWAMRITAGITVLAGMLVLAGAIAAGHHRRVRDAVMLKVLGARRRQVLVAFMLEYGLLGLATGAIAAAIGSAAAWIVVTQVMESDWAFAPAAVLVPSLIATAVTLLFGFAGTWRALGQKPAPLLRNE